MIKLVTDKHKIRIMQILLSYLLISLLSLPVAAQSQLPACQGISDKRSCYGTLKFPNGARYEGEFKGGIRFGRGIEFDHRGNHVRDGYWNDWEFSKTPFSDSAIVASNNIPPSQLPDCTSSDSNYWHQCFGVKIFPDGSRFVGEFMGGKYNGNGISYNVNPRAISQSGYWASGVLRESKPLNIEDYPFDGIRRTTNSSSIEVELAKERALRVDLENQLKVLREKSVIIPNDSKISIESARKKCVEIGIKTNSESFGRCVLQLSR